MAKEQQTLTIYTLGPNCMPCRATKRHVTRHNIPHTIINLLDDQDAAWYVRNKLGATKAPVVEAPNGDWWEEHKPTMLDQYRTH